jgi:hypothetical protein
MESASPFLEKRRGLPMRCAAGVTAVLFAAATLATAAPPITETAAVEAAADLARSVRGYSTRHPDEAGAFPPWAAGSVDVLDPLLIHAYPSLEAVYYYVPLAGPGGCSFVTLDAHDGRWQAYGRRAPGFPGVSREEAADAAGAATGRVAPPDSLRVVCAPDKRVYWYWWQPDGGPEIFVNARDVTDVRTEVPGALSDPLTAMPPDAADDRPPTRPSRPDSAYPPSFDIDVPFHYQTTDVNCAPASVQMVMDYWGPEIDQEDVAAAANTGHNGTNLSDIVRAAQFSAVSTALQNPYLQGYAERRMGYGAPDAYWSYPNENDPDFPHRHVDLKHIVSSGCPVVVSMRFAPGHFGYHARVLKGYDDSTSVYILHDPWDEGIYQGPDLHFSQGTFDQLWGEGYRWGGFIAPWRVTIDAPSEVLREAPFEVTARVVYRGPRPFGAQDETESPTVALMPSAYAHPAPGESWEKPLVDYFADTGCEFEPVTWELVAGAGAQSGTLRFLARGMLHDSSTSYVSYSDSIGGWGATAITTVDADRVTVGISGDADFAAIQDALDFAHTGDTVDVLPGIYAGARNRDLSFCEGNVVLRGIGGPATTVIDCDGSGRGFVLEGTETDGIVIEGLTVRNGRAPEGGGGGGIYVSGASPIIRNVVLESNSSDSGGGGMHCDSGASPTITHCTFFENDAPSCGGILCDSSSPLITDTVIFGSSGSGIGCAGSASPVLRSCVLYGNGHDGLPETCVAENVRFADPEFCDPARGDLRLQECSPCVGASTTGSDIGALPAKCACVQDEVVSDRARLLAASPFTSETQLHVSAPAHCGPVTLAVYDVSGQLVRTLAVEQIRPGEHRCVWRGDDDSGERVGAGIYFVRCVLGRQTLMRKVVLVR